MPNTSPLVLITGASSGIGQALAAVYAARGWRLVLWARRADAMQAWAEQQGLDAQRCHVYAVDVSDTAGVLNAAA